MALVAGSGAAREISALVITASEQTSKAIEINTKTKTTIKVLMVPLLAAQ